MKPRKIRDQNGGLCRQCGSVLGRWRSAFCSDDCRAKFYNKKALSDWKPRSVTCAMCSRVFTQKAPNHRFCSKRCLRATPKLRSVCKKCGSEFMARSGQRYCSSRCQRKNRKRRSDNPRTAKDRIKDKIRAAERYRTDPEYRERCKRSAIENYRTNPIYKVRSNLRKRVRDLVNFSDKFSNLIGCKPIFLRQWIEGQFHGAMTWKNYGKYWVVDHKLPLASFDLADPVQISQACHYTNLQPLRKSENHEKAARIIPLISQIPVQSQLF